MATVLVAKTKIEHGTEDGKLIVILEGATVKKADFSKEDWATLEEAGAVGEPDAVAVETLQENEDLRKQIDDLKAALVEAKKTSTSDPDKK